MGNFLSLKDSFIWEDNSIDRGQFIEDLNFAIDQARSYGDNVFGVPDLFDIQLAWGDFFQFLFEVAFDATERVEKFPWLSESQHLTLIRLFDFFRENTEFLAGDLQSLNAEFVNDNNALIGIYAQELEHSYVYDNLTWQESHRSFVSLFNRKQRIEYSQYFEKFFEPKLILSGQEIKSKIDRGQSHSFFIRLDIPTKIGGSSTIHNEQIHIHFNDKDKSALNIDGSWKHGGCKIPKAAGDILIKWGFKLPSY